MNAERARVSNGGLRHAAESPTADAHRAADQFHALVEATGEIVWTSSAQGEMRGPQPGWCSYTGQGEEDVQGYGWSMAVHPDDAEGTIEAWKHAVVMRAPFIFEHRVRRRDGAYRWFAVRAAPVLEPDGTLREWVGLHRDIHDEKGQVRALRMAAQAAESAREHLHSLLMHAPAPICILEGSEHRYALTNLPYNQLVGRDDLVGKTVADAFPEIVALGHVQELDEIFATGETRQGAERHLRFEQPRPGQLAEVIINFVYQPYRDHADRVCGILVVAFDVTKVVLARLASERARLAAEAAEKAQREALDFQERFVAVVGHDLRNPLAAIEMGAAVLRMRAQTANDLHSSRVLDRVTFSSRRMSRMIEQILDLAQSRIGGGLEMKPAPVDLRTVLTDVVEELRTAHPGRTIQLICPTILGAWDRDRLEQVFSNLVSNAIHYGVAEAPVTIDCRRDGTRHVVVSVHNDGEPIPEELRRHLFDPFRRGNRGGQARNTAGLGLGLYISRSIVVAHGGALEACSSAAEGTTFRVTLPCTLTSPPRSE